MDVILGLDANPENSEFPGEVKIASYQLLQVGLILDMLSH
jgi:hypothetical protein